MKIASRTVALARCRTYTTESLKGQIDRLCRACAFLPQAGDKLLLKPNLVAAGRADGLALTHPLVVRAVAEWCLDHGAAVAVGDSPAFGSGIAVMEQCGMTKALADLPVRMISFARRKKVITASGIPVTLAAEVFECDRLINLPKLKAHCQLRVTLAVKNYFGAVLGWRKAMAHMHHGGDESFVRLLVDLVAEVPEGISLIDGVVAMHRSGPMDGDPFNVGVLGASPNPVALDLAIMTLIGLDPSRSPVAQECLNRQWPGSRLQDLIFPLDTPSALAVSDFIIPDDLDPIRFQVGRFLRSSIRRVFQGLETTGRSR